MPKILNPDERVVQFSLSITKDDLKKIKSYCEEHDTSIANLIRNYIRSLE